MCPHLPIQIRSGVSFIQHLNVDRHLASSATENCIFKLISLIIWRRNPRVYIKYTGRWCHPRVRRTVQRSAVNQEGEARRGRRCDPLRGSALSSHSASYLALQDHHLCPCCTKYLLHVSILQSKHVLSTVCYACYAQDKKSPFLLSQNQE